MHIVYLIPRYFPWIGGAEVFAQNVAERLTKRGHKIDVITGLWKNPDVQTETWREQEINLNGVQIYRTKTLNVKYVKTLSCVPTLTNKLVELDRKKNYDLVHAHIFPGVQAGCIVKKLLGKTVLSTVQGGDLADYGATGGKFRRILKPWISWSLKNTDLVHAVSEHIERRARELGSKKTIVIPNGVDTKKFKPLEKEDIREKYEIPLNQNIVITVSRLAEKNGIDYLIRSMKALKESEVKLLVVGEGPQRPFLERLIDEFNLREKVELFGSIPQEKIPEYLNVADVFARPSLSEGFGISFIESMACGTPPVGTPVGGISEIIEDGENGVLVPPKNSEKLAEAIDRLLKKEKLRKRLSEKGRENVEKRYSLEVVLDQMEELYEDLTKEK